MVFSSPSYVPRFSFTPPHSIPIHEFLLRDDTRYGRHPIASSKPPFTCGITGRSYSTAEVADRVEFLARSLAARLGCRVNDGRELSKVICVYAFNTIDSLAVSWATHGLNGVSNHISSTYTVPELVHQLDRVKPLALFTCLPLLGQALEAAATVGLPRQRVFLLEVPYMGVSFGDVPPGMLTVDALIKEGSHLKPLTLRKWRPGQGERQVAFLCSSSGTSGMPKNVMVSHRNVIANIMQIAVFESNHRNPDPEYCLGLLPFSHNLALVAVAHLAVYRGDGVVVLPGFDLQDTLFAIQQYQIGRLFLIPPIITTMLRAPSVTSRYDLSSVTSAIVGATVLSSDVAAGFDALFPGCKLIQGYGLTETTVAVTLTNPADNVFCSCGSLFPGSEGKLVDENGLEVVDHGVPGELYVRSPTVMLGYLDNEAETKSMLSPDGWLRTGDLVEFRVSEGGHSHLFFIERVKDLIKVRGMQVSPTELESFLLRHPQVDAAVVVSVPDESAGELPLAFVVKRKSPKDRDWDDDILKLKVHAYVNASLAPQKRLAGGIEFVDAIPKTGSGKVQRKVLKAWALDIVETRRKAVAPSVAVFEFDSDDELIDDSD